MGGEQCGMLPSSAITVTTMVGADAGLSVGMSVWFYTSGGSLDSTPAGTGYIAGRERGSSTRKLTLCLRQRQNQYHLQTAAGGGDGTRAFFVDNAGAWIRPVVCGRCPHPIYQ